jgi:hypothetical protein
VSSETWPDGQGVLVLPDGRRVRGRGLHRSAPASSPLPDFGLYLLGKPPPTFSWPSRWLRWPDFRLPSDPDDARAALTEVHERCATERVEVACRGGRGRTGTALACLSVLAGVDPAGAVAFVRQHYDPRAVETPWQRRYVRQFRP